MAYMLYRPIDSKEGKTNAPPPDKCPWTGIAMDNTPSTNAPLSDKIPLFDVGLTGTTFRRVSEVH